MGDGVAVVAVGDEISVAFDKVLSVLFAATCEEMASLVEMIGGVEGKSAESSPLASRAALVMAFCDSICAISVVANLPVTEKPIQETSAKPIVVT